MTPLQTGPYLYTVCGVIVFVIFLSWNSLQDIDSARRKWIAPIHEPSVLPHVGSNFVSAGWSEEGLATQSEIGRASNATLGFEKIFVLALKERSDKKDAIALGASLTGLSIEFSDAVNGDDVLDKARPPGMQLQGGALGSWRSHMNILRSVFQNKWSSVFIMEDDVDWDIRIRSQMHSLAKGVRTLSSISPTSQQLSPYGDDWDIIWPGHCGEVLPTHDDRRYIISDDETVAPKAHQPWLIGLKDLPDYTRMVHRAGAPLCTFGYAVSYRGAEKILLALAVKGAGSLAFDNSLAYLCRDGFLNIQCYSVEPQLFHHHRPAGSVSKDSDIAKDDDSTAVREKGFTEVMVWSTRLNLEQLITGSKDYVEQW